MKRTQSRPPSRRGIVLVVVMALLALGVGGVAWAALSGGGRGEYRAPVSGEARLDALSRAKIAYADRDLTQSEKLLRDILRKTPGDLGATLLLARVTHDLGRAAEAARLYKRVLQANGKSFTAAQGLAEIHEAAGQSDMAISYWQRASALKRDDPTLWRKLGMAQVKAGDSRGAFTSLSQSLALDRSQSDLAVFVGDLAAGRATKPTSAPGLGIPEVPEVPRPGAPFGGLGGSGGFGGNGNGAGGNPAWAHGRPNHSGQPNQPSPGSSSPFSFPGSRR